MQAKKVTDQDLKQLRSDYWMPKKGMLKYNKNCKAYITSDNFLEATSYNHWSIITEIDGLYFFNWYSYSNSTSKHQHKISSLVRDLGIEYITVKYHKDIRCKRLVNILEDKIEMLYSRENDLSLSRATKHAVYSENEFNGILSDIRAIAKAMKLSESKLNKMLLNAEIKATESMLNGLCNKLELENTRKEYSKQIESLKAIAI